MIGPLKDTKPPIKSLNRVHLKKPFEQNEWHKQPSITPIVSNMSENKSEIFDLNGFVKKKSNSTHIHLNLQNNIHAGQENSITKIDLKKNNKIVGNESSNIDDNNVVDTGIPLPPREKNIHRKKGGNITNISFDKNFTSDLENRKSSPSYLNSKTATANSSSGVKKDTCNVCALRASNHDSSSDRIVMANTYKDSNTFIRENSFSTESSSFFNGEAHLKSNGFIGSRSIPQSSKLVQSSRYIKKKRPKLRKIIMRNP